MEKNALYVSDNTYLNKNIQQVGKCLENLFSEDQLDEIAIRHGFIKRKRSLSAASFLSSLVFNNDDTEKCSLLGLKLDLYANAKVNVSRTAIHKKFTPEAVSFMEEVLSNFLTSQTSGVLKDILPPDSPFTALYIKDSSKFTIPQVFAKEYPAFGGYGKKEKGALMNIQYEYDLLSGESQYLELTKATRNDQQDSKETVSDMKQGALYMRDLGYITTNYLKAFDTNGAFYINRLPKIGVYLKNEDSFDAICWKDIRHHFKKNDAASLETEVYLGKKEKIGSRLLIVPVPEQVAAGRIRKAKQGGNRKKGYAISGEYKAKAHFNLFITNVPAKVLSAEKVILAYRLRWQIEILFKTWKSHLNIHKCKPMKIERFKCQLIGNLIWILISNKLFQITKSVITRHDNSKSCSPIKFFKFSKYIKQELRAVVHVCNVFSCWFSDTFCEIADSFTIEKRLKKQTHPEIINLIFNG